MLLRNVRIKIEQTTLQNRAFNQIANKGNYGASYEYGSSPFQKQENDSTSIKPEVKLQSDVIDIKTEAPQPQKTKTPVIQKETNEKKESEAVESNAELTQSDLDDLSNDSNDEQVFFIKGDTGKESAKIKRTRIRNRRLREERRRQKLKMLSTLTMQQLNIKFLEWEIDRMQKSARQLRKQLTNK